MSQREAGAKTTRILHGGDSLNLIGYLCYPTDIRVSEETDDEGMTHLTVSEFEICPEDSFKRCALRRGLKAEGVGSCYRVEIKIDVRSISP